VLSRARTAKPSLVDTSESSTSTPGRGRTEGRPQRSRSSTRNRRPRVADRVRNAHKERTSSATSLNQALLGAARHAHRRSRRTHVRSPPSMSRANSRRFSVCGSKPGLPRPAIAPPKCGGCCDDDWSPPPYSAPSWCVSPESEGYAGVLPAPLRTCTCEGGIGVPLSPRSSRGSEGPGPTTVRQPATARCQCQER